MTQPIEQLIDEHGRIRGMLSCFEGQLDCVERAERPDYEILNGSIAYCQEYLDRWHHPREDVLLEFLQRRAPSKARACADLEAQHVGLGQTTNEIVKIFEQVERDAEYPRAQLVEMGRILVDDYRRHLDWEEENFFPAVRSYLLPEDWREIAPHFSGAADPLTQSSIDRRYWILFRALDEL